MKKSIEADTPRSCTGCSACMAACPKNAISVVMNEDGFLQAVVDKEQCIDCGICQTVCSRFISPEKHTFLMEKCSVAGAHSSDSTVHKTTTSGGLAYELSKYGIENGYKVFGVVYDYILDKAVGVLVDTLSGLESLKGSKYLQADISEALCILCDETKKNPDGKYICFGTPCQIFGIRQLIERKKLVGDFLLIDLFCHGVPSYNVWRSYVKTLHRQLGAFRKVNFRYKGNGWHQYTIRIDGEKGNYQEFAYKDMFYRFFFDNVALNNSCFTCDFRKSRVASDLRLGDFWGKKYEYREDGVSAVLVATEKGRQWLKELSQHGRIEIDKFWDASVCLASQSIHDYANEELRDSVMKYLREEENLLDIRRWYSTQLSMKVRIRLALKSLVCSLPLPLLIRMRKIVRNV